MAYRSVTFRLSGEERDLKALKGFVDKTFSRAEGYILQEIEFAASQFDVEFDLETDFALSREKTDEGT